MKTEEKELRSEEKRKKTDTTRIQPALHVPAYVHNITERERKIKKYRKKLSTNTE